jgi:hypothetical protein
MHYIYFTILQFHIDSLTFCNTKDDSENMYKNMTLSGRCWNILPSPRCPLELRPLPSRASTLTISVLDKRRSETRAKKCDHLNVTSTFYLNTVAYAFVLLELLNNIPLDFKDDYFITSAFKLIFSYFTASLST